MAKLQSNKTKYLFPVWGILLFIILYIFASLVYPGGSDINKNSTGFSWQHNYWCELMADKAQNGMPNTSSPVAITAMIILAISLSIFWYQVPTLFIGIRKSTLLIRFCGIASMICTIFLLTGFHDIVINVAAALGCIAIAVLLVNLFRSKIYWLFYMGILCLLLVGVNNYVYYSPHLLYYLPVIQKISFLILLSWFVLISLQLYRKIKRDKLSM